MIEQDIKAILERLSVIEQQQREILQAQTVSGRTPGEISITLKEAAKRTGMSRESLYNMCKSGVLPFSQPAGSKGQILIRTEDLAHLMAGQARIPETFVSGVTLETWMTGKRNKFSRTVRRAAYKASGGPGT